MHKFYLKTLVYGTPKMTSRPVHVHLALHSALKKIIDAENLASKPGLLETMELCDFGVRFKLELIGSTKIESGIRSILRVSVPGWEQLRETAKTDLLTIYGDSVSFDPQAHPSISFSILIKDAVLRFDSEDDGLGRLSQLRTQVIGAPILRSLERVSQGKGNNSTANGKGDLQLYTLKTHPRCGTCHCLSSDEKTMIIFIVKANDTTERALVRLFLQQFELAQKKVAQSPHCEFRRANEPTSEVERLVTSGHVENYEDAIGFLSFTFFPFHVKTPGARGRATQLMVNFFPYLDKHIKSTKSYMHARMRLMKDELLRELRDSFKTTQLLHNKYGRNSNQRLVMGDRMKCGDYRQVLLEHRDVPKNRVVVKTR